MSADGEVFVPDGHARTIRVFLPTGQYVRSIGSEGEGPGEFQSIDGIAHSSSGDEFYVRDPLLNRISVFDSLGAFQRSFLLSRPYAQFSRRTSLWVDSRDRIYDLTQVGTPPSYDKTGVVSYASSGEVIDTTVIAVSTPGRLLLVGSNGQPRSAALLPFGAYARAAVSGAGAIVGGTGVEYSVQRFVDAQVVGRVTKAATVRPVPDWASDTVAAISQRLLEIDRMGTIERDELPQNQPFYNYLLIDAAGFLWVAREGLDHRPAARYEIFDPGGVYVGLLTIPSILVDEVGLDYIAGRRVDDLGVETVAVLRLSRAPPPAT